MIVYIENPIDATKRLLNVINKQWDTKSRYRNERHFCISTMKYWKQKSGGKSHSL